MWQNGFKTYLGTINLDVIAVKYHCIRFGEEILS